MTAREDENVDRMNEYRDVSENVRQLRKNALELDDLVDNMQWIAAGGRGTATQERFNKLAEASRRICEVLEEMDVPEPREVRDRE